MNYRETKALMMECYPRLFVDEADVLHHLFFVNGGGYHWKDGELVALETPEEYRATAKAIHDQSRARLTEQVANGATYLKDLIPSDDPAVERRRERAWRKKSAGEKIDPASKCFFLRRDGSVERKMYPICEYANILTVPQDVKPDWLKAARKALAVAATFRFTVSDRKYLRNAAKILLTSSVVHGCVSATSARPSARRAKDEQAQDLLRGRKRGGSGSRPRDRRSGWQPDLRGHDG